MTDEDYLAYLPESKLCEELGSVAHSVGHTRILSRSDYPPVRHPDDHYFDWEKGRTLQAYQFALISEGRGILQTAPNTEIVHEVETGDVILLYPGIWHRFAPDPEIGWTESWIELTGAAFDRMAKQGVFPLDRPLWRAGAYVEELFQKIGRLGRSDALKHQPTLSMLGLQLLAQLCESRLQFHHGKARIVEKARQILAEESGVSAPFEDLARQLGVSYSTLRRLFREHLGMSLKQYQMEIRVRRACELLRGSDRSIKEIAAHLGYNSAFHFSTQFQKVMGLAPSYWRERNGAKWLPVPEPGRNEVNRNSKD